VANEEHLTSQEIVEELARREMREDFEKFFRAYPPSPGYRYGRHTLAVIARLGQAVKDYERGISTNLVVTIPFRHGKSDIISRRFPAWFLGRNPDAEMILACYSDELATDMSRKARQCFRETSWVFGLTMSDESSSVGHWEIAGRKGAFTATGIGGSIVGRGAACLGLDDYLKNREEAESQRIRDKQWDSFNDDLRTRLAPVHILVVCANRWHVDDLAGRMLDRCNPANKSYDPEAPVFEELRFPMQDSANVVPNNPDGWLFPQRFPSRWYREQRSNLGTYGWNSLAQQNPQPRQGKLLRADLVEFLPSDEFDKLAEGARWARGWDVASTAKEVMKPDPDYTVGTRSAIHKGCLFIDDVVRGQWTAGIRDKIIKTCGIGDGGNTVVYVEVVAGYKDTYELVSDALAGISVVRPYTPAVDKVARASPFEPYFEMKHVYVRKAPWNAEWVSELSLFPNGKHDDQVDSLVVALHEQLRQANGGMGFST
jgi:predicted phage terminase large subunit-like protein